MSKHGSWKVQALVPPARKFESDRRYVTEAEAQRDIDWASVGYATPRDIEPLFCLGIRPTHMFSADMRAPRPLPKRTFEPDFKSYVNPLNKAANSEEYA